MTIENEATGFLIAEPCASVSADGKVCINWQAVEQTIESDDQSKVAIARLMLAIRDDTYGWKSSDRIGSEQHGNR